jgi:hypothetical protein
LGRAGAAVLCDRIHPLSVFLARHLDEQMKWLAAGRGSLTIIAGLLIVAGGSLVILGAIPVAVPLIGLPIAVFSVGIIACDGAVVAAGYLVLTATAAGVLATL